MAIFCIWACICCTIWNRVPFWVIFRRTSSFPSKSIRSTAQRAWSESSGLKNPKEKSSLASSFWAMVLKGDAFWDVTTMSNTGRRYPVSTPKTPSVWLGRSRRLSKTANSSAPCSPVIRKDRGSS